jgi:hypothetical protein
MSPRSSIRFNTSHARGCKPLLPTFRCSNSHATADVILAKPESRYSRSRLRKSIRKVFITFICLLCLFGKGGFIDAQSTANRCFLLNVRLNQKVLDGPRSITFLTKDGDWVINREDNCFDLTNLPAHEARFDLSFLVPGNKIYLTSIGSAFLAGPWDIDLMDKGPTSGLPKGASVKRSCRIVFHVGEPETGMIQTPCRQRLKANGKWNRNA